MEEIENKKRRSVMWVKKKRKIKKGLKNAVRRDVKVKYKNCYHNKVNSATDKGTLLSAQKFRFAYRTQMLQS